MVTAGGPVPLRAIQLVQHGSGDEGYELTITADRVVITATAPAGLFYGVQTLQAAAAGVRRARGRPGRHVAAAACRACASSTGPRFAWRGAMLDVARHFFAVDDVKRYIDLIALHKLNRLHLHLSDDQGWRIEINAVAEPRDRRRQHRSRRRRRRLLHAGAVRRHRRRTPRHRFITIVPEIDMPGHTNAALASYAELNCNGVAPPLYTGIEVGFSTLCVDKDDHLHVHRRRDARDRRDDAGRRTSTSAATRSRRSRRRSTRSSSSACRTIVAAHGKQMIGWDEIAPVDSCCRRRIVQHWRPDGSPRTPAKGAKVIMSPANRAYLDMKIRHRPRRSGLSWAGFIDVRDAYDWDPATVAAGVPERQSSASKRRSGPRRSRICTTSSSWRFRGWPRRRDRLVAGRPRVGSTSGVGSARRRRAGPRSGSTSIARRRCRGHSSSYAAPALFDGVGRRAAPSSRRIRVGRGSRTAA